MHNYAQLQKWYIVQNSITVADSASQYNVRKMKQAIQYFCTNNNELQLHCTLLHNPNLQSEHSETQQKCIVVLPVFSFPIHSQFPILCYNYNNHHKNNLSLQCTRNCRPTLLHRSTCSTHSYLELGRSGTMIEMLNIIVLPRPFNASQALYWFAIKNFHVDIP